MSDLCIETRLLAYIQGSKYAQSQSSGKGGNLGNYGKKLGMTNNGEDNLSSIVLEGGNANANITAPGTGFFLPIYVDRALGAILAIGMMYLRTHNVSIASYLSPPQTEFELEYIRPDLLLLRIVARNLIMWDNIDASLAWAEGKDNMPQVVRSIKEHIPGMIYFRS